MSLLQLLGYLRILFAIGTFAGAAYLFRSGENGSLIWVLAPLICYIVCVGCRRYLRKKQAGKESEQ